MVHTSSPVTVVGHCVGSMQHFFGLGSFFEVVKVVALNKL